MNLVNIRQAKLDEAEISTNIVTRLEVYWGFDGEYMYKSYV